MFFFCILVWILFILPNDFGELNCNLFIYNDYFNVLLEFKLPTDKKLNSFKFLSWFLLSDKNIYFY